MALSTAKAAALAAALAVFLLGIGYSAIHTSTQKSLSELLKAKTEIEATVEARTVDLGRGTYGLLLPEGSFEVEWHGSYGVLAGPWGQQRAVFIITDGESFALAVFDAFPTYAESPAIGTGGSAIVLRVSYNPGEEAVLSTPQGNYRLPLVHVESVLRGCHSSYSGGVASSR